MCLNSITCTNNGDKQHNVYIFTPYLLLAACISELFSTYKESDVQYSCIQLLRVLAYQTVRTMLPVGVGTVCIGTVVLVLPY